MHAPIAASRNMRRCGVSRRRGILILAAGAAGGMLPLLPGGKAAAETLHRGGVLTMIVTPEPSQIVLGTTIAPAAAIVATKIIEGLVEYGPDMAPRPQLAEAWTFSDDGLTYTFRLRKNVKWHDGKDFTAADVAFSLNQIWRRLHPRGRVTFADVKAVQTPDAHTVVITLSSPAPALRFSLSSYESPVFPRHLYEGTDIAANPFNTRPIGTGPFVFREWRPGSHLVLDRNGAYWLDGQPYLDRIVVRFVADAAARVKALESGAAHYAAHGAVPFEAIARLKTLPDLAIETTGYAFSHPIVILEMNAARRPLNDPRVRRALALAIDRDALLRTVWHGAGNPASGPVSRRAKEFYTGDVRRHAVDVPAAEQQLDAAGFKRGANRKRFVLKFTHPPVGAIPRRIGEAVKEQLQRIGIEVEPVTADMPSYVRRVYANYDFDLNAAVFPTLPDPATGLARLYGTKGIQKGVPLSNVARYSSPAMDALLARFLAEPNPALRRSLAHDIQRLAMEDLPILPLVELDEFTVVSKKLMEHATTADGAFSNFAGVWLQP